jgi:signal peptide peptidase SppA
MKTTRYAHVAQWMASSIWAILPSKFLAMQEALSFVASGGEFSPEEIKAIVGAAPKSSGSPRGSIAVLPLMGVIARRAGMMGEASGGTSIEAFASQFRALLADQTVSTIVLEVDSPGGVIDGVDEMAAEIYHARETKPIVAIADTIAASAAYWIASAASEFVVTPSGQVGSIGVFAEHEDRSGLMTQMGVKRTLISAGRYKVEGNPYEPLSEEAQAAAQERVNEVYDMFVKAVARHRGVGVADVREGFGEGRMVGAKKALESGMVDRVETMQEMMRRLMRRRQGGSANPPAKTEEPMMAKAEEPAGRSDELLRLQLEILQIEAQ